MARFDVLGPAHKGLRSGLSNLQFKMAQSDLHDVEHMKSVLADLEWMWKILDAHADGEDKFLYPLLEKTNKKMFDTLEKEHLDLEKTQKDLLKELNSVVGLKEDNKREEQGFNFIKNYNDYVARYFTHLQNEEFQAIPELWKSYEDSKLMGALSKFSTVTPPPVAGKFAEMMFPAINFKERVGFMMNLKQNAPEPLFKSFLGTAERVLEKESYTKLEKAVK